MNSKLGTKIFVAKYDFTRKNVAKNSGLRFRLEQKLFEESLKHSPVSLKLHLGTHYTNKKKWDHFIGLSLRMSFPGDQLKKSKMQERMMDTVIRDVDIRAAKYLSQPKESLFLGDKEVRDVYFIADSNSKCGGDGSSASPYCISEYKEKLNGKDSNFIISPIGSFSKEKYEEVMTHPNAIDNITHTAALTTQDLKTAFLVKDHFPEMKLVDMQADERTQIYSAVTEVNDIALNQAPQSIESNNMAHYPDSANYVDKAEFDIGLDKNLQTQPVVAEEKYAIQELVEDKSEIAEYEAAALEAIEPERYDAQLDNIAALNILGQMPEVIQPEPELNKSISDKVTRKKITPRQNAYKSPKKGQNNLNNAQTSPKSLMAKKMQKIADNAKAIARAEGFERQENRVGSPPKLKSKGSHARNDSKALNGRSVNNPVLIKPQSAMAIELQKYYERGQSHGKALGFQPIGCR